MEQQNIRQFFMEESAQNGWKAQRDSQAMLKGLWETMENTRLRTASCCFGNQVKLDACNALFREAQAGIDLARRALQGVTPEVVAEQDAAEGSKTPGIDWVQLALLFAGFMCCALSIGMSVKKAFLMPVCALCLGAAVVREAGRAARQANPGSAVMKLLSVFIRKEPFRSAIERRTRPKVAPSGTKPAVRACISLGAGEMEKACLHQIDIIEENLPAFCDEPVKAGGSKELWPLVRTLLQEKYACGFRLPEDVEDELMRCCRTNGFRVLEYSPEYAGFFRTQPMEETFTIFPAVLDADGRVLETGQAGVKEEQNGAVLFGR